MMGQAKMRKKNGTYPTPEQIAQWDEERRRRNTKKWNPQPSDLLLPYVPEAHRAEIREFLAPALERMKKVNIPVEGGHCWQVAQALALAATNSRCNYVEGVWARTEDANMTCDCGEHAPVPHAWNTVDGYPICLVTELYNWRSFGSDGDWSREPLREYTFTELNKMVEDGEINPLDDLAFGDYGHITNIPDEQMPEHFRCENQPGEKIAPWRTVDSSSYYVNGKFDNKLHDRWLKSDDYKQYREAIDAFNAEWNEQREQWEKDRLDFIFQPAIDRFKCLNEKRVA